MTSRESLRIINLKDRFDIEIIIQANEVLYDLVDRDTPMKPLIDKIDFGVEYKCPVCESVVWLVHVRKDENFCNKCGQRLDWRASNEKV